MLSHQEGSTPPTTIATATSTTTTTTTHPTKTTTPQDVFSVGPLPRELAIETFYQWAVTEHWNPGTEDLQKAYTGADPNGFFAGTLTNPLTGTSKIISIVSGVRYSSEQAWLGYYIADPAYRGHGYGLKTFQTLLETHLKDVTSVALDGVTAQVGNYQKSGFTNIAWLNERRHGPNLNHFVEVQEKDLADKIRSGNLTFTSNSGSNSNNTDTSSNSDITEIVDLATIDLDEIQQLEQKFVGLNRPEFVNLWTKYHQDPENHRFGVAVISISTSSSKDNNNNNTITKKRTLLGYGCARPAISSYRVGPIYAESGEIARQILVKLAVDVVEADKRHSLGIPLKFDADVPNTNKAAIQMFDTLGWVDTFPCLRMWKGPIPKFDVNGVYAVATLELG
ncbi:hypothetical protein BG004_008258 [Podila humilis]|nr:hypothetical protein BG004_008258 [Podila humilis]